MINLLRIDSHCEVHSTRVGRMRLPDHSAGETIPRSPKSKTRGARWIQPDIAFRSSQSAGIAGLIQALCMGKRALGAGDPGECGHQTVVRAVKPGGQWLCFLSSPGGYFQPSIPGISESEHTGRPIMRKSGQR